MKELVIKDKEEGYVNIMFCLREYIKGAIEMTKSKTYGATKKQKKIYENKIKQMKELLSQINSLQRAYLKEPKLNILKLVIGQTQNKSAEKMILSEYNKNMKNIQELPKEIYKNIQELNGEPSLFGIYEDKKNDSISMAHIGEIKIDSSVWEEYDYSYTRTQYGFNSRIVRQLFSRAKTEMEKESKEKYSQFYNEYSKKHKKELHENKEEKFIGDRLKEIEDAKVGLTLYIPQDVSKKLSKSDVKRYKKIKNKKLTALRKKEEKTRELTGPYSKVKKIREAIEELEKVTSIDAKVKSKILVSLQDQLTKERLKINKIQQKIKNQSVKRGIAQYSDGRFAEIREMQKYLETHDDYEMKQKVEEFWKNEIEQTVHPKRKRQKLLPASSTGKNNTTVTRNIRDDIRVDVDVLHSNGTEVTQNNGREDNDINDKTSEDQSVRY